MQDPRRSFLILLGLGAAHLALGGAGTAVARHAEPLRPDPVGTLEAGLRTSLAETAAVITRADADLRLTYPVRLAFAPDQPQLLAGATGMLDALAEALRSAGRTRVTIAVYTDAIGSRDFNAQQSHSRATAVLEYLVSRGLPPERLAIGEGGESAPLRAPNTPEGRDLNRRLELTISALSS